MIRSGGIAVVRAEMPSCERETLSQEYAGRICDESRATLVMSRRQFRGRSVTDCALNGELSDIHEWVYMPVVPLVSTREINGDDRYIRHLICQGKT